MAFPEPFDDSPAYVERDVALVTAQALVPVVGSAAPLAIGFTSGMAVALVAVAIGHAAVRSLRRIARPGFLKNRNLTDVRGLRRP